jgi:hypothetical protein
MCVRGRGTVQEGRNHRASIGHVTTSTSQPDVRVFWGGGGDSNVQDQRRDQSASTGLVTTSTSQPACNIYR